MSRRTDRIASLIQSELAELLLRGLKDPRIGFVTVTGVEVTADLKFARVYYSKMDDEEKRGETQKALEHAAGFLQRKIADALKLRFTPKLSFHYDESLDEGMRIERILEELRSKDGSKK